MGGTELKFGLIDGEHRLVFRSKAATPPRMKELLELIRELWEGLKKKEGKRIRAVGFGVPGIFSLKEQKILQSPNYPELDGFDLKTALTRIIKDPFWVDNDANMAAFGEYKSGAGRGTQSLVFLTLGTGVGSGIILEGDLWHGKCGFAAELGHIVVNPEGEPCNCGSRGCLETEACAPPIIRNYKSLFRKTEAITSEEVFRRATNGDEAAS